MTSSTVDHMSSRQTTAVLTSVAIIVWGSAFLLSVVVGSALLLLTSDSGEAPNWAEIATALGTGVLAVATLALAVAAFFALGGLRESRRVRNVTAMTDMSRRWDAKQFRDVRNKIQEYAGHGPSSRDKLRDKVIQLRDANASEYRELLTEPSFLEDLAISVKYEGIDFEIVMASLGYIVWDRWCLWQPTIETLQKLRNEKSVFENFKNLAYRVKAVARIPDVDAWEGPKY